MGRQVKSGVRIHQHGYTFDDLKRMSSTLAQDIGRRRATVSENTGSVTCARRASGCFTAAKNDFDVGTHWRFVSAAQLGTYGCKGEAIGCNTGENCET